MGKEFNKLSKHTIFNKSASQTLQSNSTSVVAPFHALGNSEILKEHKIAFFCSRKVPAQIILKTYDWAIEQRKKGNCIISGFHSKIEKDVLHYLLKGKQPVILVHARCLKQREDKNLLKAVDENRLLIISPFEKDVKRITSETAEIRNQFMARLANEIFIAYAVKGGNIDNLINTIKNKKVSTFKVMKP